MNSATGWRVHVHVLHLTLMAFLLQLLMTCSAFVLFQIITYRDYLPLLLGEETRKWIPLYSGYNDSVNPTVSNVFSLAFRFGHTLVQPFVSRLDDSFQPLGSFSHVPLHLTFCATWRIIMEGKNMGQPAVLVWSWSRHSGGGQLVRHMSLDSQKFFSSIYLTDLTWITVPFNLEGAHDMSTQGAADKSVVC